MGFIEIPLKSESRRLNLRRFRWALRHRGLGLGSLVEAQDKGDRLRPQQIEWMAERRQTRLRQSMQHCRSAAGTEEGFQGLQHRDRVRTTFGRSVPPKTLPS